jgi:hypothetical protein
MTIDCYQMMYVNILSPDKVDTRLVESYKTDDLARSLSVLACSMHGSLLSVSPEGYIVYTDMDKYSGPLIYAPVSEAQRLFMVLCNDNRYYSIDDLVKIFLSMVYCPDVRRKDLVQWSLSVETNCDTGFGTPEFTDEFLETSGVVVDEKLNLDDDYFAQLVASCREPYVVCGQNILYDDSGSESEDALFMWD